MSPMPNAMNQPQESWISSNPAAIDAAIDLFSDMIVTSIGSDTLKTLIIDVL
jgi:hypothetical protein